MILLIEIHILTSRHHGSQTLPFDLSPIASPLNSRTSAHHIVVLHASSALFSVAAARLPPWKLSTYTSIEIITATLSQAETRKATSSSKSLRVRPLLPQHLSLIVMSSASENKSDVL